MSTPDLIDGTKPRRRARVMMHVSDAFAACDDNLRARVQCALCGYETGWRTFRTVTEAKRGVPCEWCNPP